MTPMDVPKNQAPCRRGCSALLYHMPVIRLQPGIKDASAAPRKKRATIKPAKFEHAAIHATQIAQTILDARSVEGSKPDGIIRAFRQNLQAAGDKLSQWQSDEKPGRKPSEGEISEVKNAIAPRVLVESQILAGTRVSGRACRQNIHASGVSSPDPRGCP